MAAECDEIVRKLRSAFAGAKPVRLAVLFGSAAKGRQRATSDLDVGVVPAHNDWALRDELDLASLLTRATGRQVDLVRLDRASVILRWEVARGYVPILAEAPADLTSFLTSAALDHADMEHFLAGAQRVLLQRMARRPGSTRVGG